ncbi:MAG TPA: c-type cytochrome [Bacteroidota bacterium]|nr:c-type cytochrome [Bacteroidota bacterium]
MISWQGALAAMAAAVIASGSAPAQQMEHHHEGGAAQDSVRRAQAGAQVEHELAELRERIAGHEKDPAPQVFKNIQMFKDVEAGRVLGAMGFFSRALGVSCKHCHVVDQWEKEDKPEKQIARDMAAMVTEINSHLLKNIKNLDSPDPRIGCWTCHRGDVIPQGMPPRERKD